MIVNTRITECDMMHDDYGVSHDNWIFYMN